MADDADSLHFMKLLGMVPPRSQFCEDGNDSTTNTDAELQTEARWGKSAAKKKKKVQERLNSQNPQDQSDHREEKIKGKKDSKQKKKKKEKTGSKVNVQEAQEKLRARIAELQAKRAQNLTGAERQERKRLERKRRRLNSSGKPKNKQKNDDGHGENGVPAPQELPAKKAPKPIVTKEGKLVFSKFDFRKSGEKERSSELAGKDFKRILSRLEQREAKVARLKDTDSTAASQLEKKYVWQDALMRAQGQKVKDDKNKLKQAIKRKEKFKASRKTKWDQRKKTEEKNQRERQQKRQDNIQKQKDDKKAKIRKKMIKKGRILPGLQK